MANIKQIFAQAIEVPPEQRAAFLEQQCAGDAQVRAAVEELIEAHEHAGGFLAGPTIDSSHDTSTTGDAPGPSVPPQRIGAYRLIEPIGEGGFGTVYLAEQEHPVRRHVALKVIKLGMDTQQVIARF